MLVVDDQGRILLVNEQAQRMFGYRREELLGRSIELLVPEEHRGVHPGHRERYLAAPEPRLMGTGRELYGRRRDGSNVAVEIGLNPWNTPAGHLVVASIVDISQRKQAEARERELLAQLEARVAERTAELEQRAQFEHWLRMKEAVNRVLVESGELAAVGSRMLEVIGEAFGWELGELWLADEQAGLLRRAAAWHSARLGETEFEAHSRTETFAPGVGLPGLVWATRQPLWLPDAATDTTFTRASLAGRDGLHGACGLPIGVGERVVGVATFLGGVVRPPDAELLGLMAEIGSTLSQFIDRTRATEALRASELRLRVALEAGRMGAWEWDAGSGRVSWSPGLEAIHGLAPGTFGGTFAAFQRDMHMEDRATVLEAISRALA
ncbi:MAG: PAS domain S-box protein, partial [Armatimonadetes bacterium]|nr:PAS domain S-box protein [Armatimonadota bacterium]